MTFNNEIEKTKKEIEVLTKKLSFLEEIEKQRWQGFQAGYEFAYAISTAKEVMEKVQEEQKWDAVRESVKWCEEHPDKDPLDCLKPQTPEQTEQSLKEAFREAVKQGVVSSTKPQTLTDLIYDWWERVFGDTDDTETCIENLVDEISLWLPTEHETNSYKWNECLRMIREKLR